MTENVEAQLVARIDWAWNQGCPVAGSSLETRKLVAKIARRRWNSFRRRRRGRSDSREERIADLATGLCEKFETDGRKMAGPLFADYLWLAEQLAPILEDPQA